MDKEFEKPFKKLKRKMVIGYNGLIGNIIIDVSDSIKAILFKILKHLLKKRSFLKNLKSQKSLQFLKKVKKSVENYQPISILPVHKYGTTKQEYVRGNHVPFMNKTLSKVLIHRTMFRNKYLKNKPDKSKRKQQNYCVSLPRKPRKKYHISKSMFTS